MWEVSLDTAAGEWKTNVAGVQDEFLDGHGARENKRL